MLQRVLGASLIQALRAAALLLIPFWLIALVAWATAGSISGSTSDPIRAATWIWLGGHHVPFALTSNGTPGLLSYLPIGALILPFFVIRNGLVRTFDNLHGQYSSIGSVRLIYSLCYAIIATALAFVARTPEVQPITYIAFPTTFILALLASATVERRTRISLPISLASRIVAIALGLSGLAVAISLGLNFKDAQSITTLLEPGYLGGLLHIALNVMYLPNIFMAALAYFAGAGVALGKGTLIAPFVDRIGEIPALVILAATPTGRHYIALIGIAVFIALGVLLTLWAGDIRTIAQTLLLFTIAIATLSYLASGSLLTDAMGAVGVSIWKTTLIVVGEVAVGAIAALFFVARKAR